MSEEYINSDIDRGAVANALDAGPTNEPVLAHLDEWRKAIIMETLYVYDNFKNEDGQVQRCISRVKYPELQNFAAVALSHVTLILNLPWNQTISIYLDFRQRYLAFRKKYRGDKDALTLIKTLDEVFEMALFGGALDGSHQRYIWHVTGGSKELDVKHTTRPEERR